jgi:hypothetical protein
MTDRLTTVRLQLKTLGYAPIPLKIDKRPYLGWPREPNDPASIAQWARYAGCVATGIRLYRSPSLLVLDIDIRIVAVRDAILQAYEERWPQFMAGCVRRHSHDVPLALIGRSDSNKGTRKSRRWKRTDSETEKDNLVEVFTRHSKRFIVVDGAHSAGRGYGYHGRPLWDVAPAELPEFPPEDISSALGIADGIMQAAGLVQKQAAILGKSILYDLHPEMPITLEDGEELTLAELERDLKNRPRQRTVTYPTPWDPRSATPRVLATLGRDGLCLWDTKTETSHRWAWRKPPESFAAFAAQLRALEKTR